MRSNFLKYTWKGTTGYSYGYVLITNKFAIDDIIKSKKKIILWGWRPETYPVKCILEENGLKADYVCDVVHPDGFQDKYPAGGGYQKIRPYRELLKEQEQYYFIIALDNNYDIDVAMKLIQYAGCDEFGIVYSGYTKDFYGVEELQHAFFETVNEVFEPFDFLHDKSNLENICLASLQGAGYWDVPYRIIYDLYKKVYERLDDLDVCISVNNTHVNKPKYLEIGPGIGVMSLSLKKLLDIDLTWVVIPDTESRWSELKRDSSKQIMEKYNINIVEGYIETDNFSHIGKYDVIVLAQVMEHLIFNPVNTFKKLADLMEDGGRIFVSVPEEVFRYNVQNYHEMPWPDELLPEERERRKLINAFGHFHEYSYAEALEVFQESGLECIFHKWTHPIHHFMLRKADPS